MRENNEKLIVYGHDYCGQAQMLARMLDEHEIDHEWRDVAQGDPAYQDELRELANGNLSVPTVIFPDGTVMVEPWPNQVLDYLGHERPSFLDKLFGLLAG